MKPVRIAFQGFGAFPGHVEIDLREVGRDGLFLISGDTGAGKTTLLDAMCYALYNTSSSGISTDPGKGSFESMRSRFLNESDKKTQTFVELELEKNGERFLFRRTLKPRPRAAGFDASSRFDRWNGSAWEPVLSNPTDSNVTAEAKKLIGLDADQFRQIIILPQGRFEQLLTSDSNEKEKILSTLFAADSWRNAVERMKTELSVQARKITEKKDQIAGRLSVYSCGNEQELEQKLLETGQGIPALETESRRAADVYTETNKRYQAASADMQVFELLDRRRQALKDLEDRRDGFRKKEEDLRVSLLAENLRSAWEAVRRRRADCALHLAAAGKARAAAEAAQAAQALADKNWKEHDAKRQTCENGKKYILRLENARGAYKTYSEHVTAAAAAGEALKQAKAANEKAEALFSAAEKAQADALEKSRDADETSEALWTRYVAGTAGRLAQELMEGKPCPVCGSTSHPRPADVPAEHVSDARMDAARKAQENARKKYTAATEDYRQAQTGLRSAGENLAKAQAGQDSIQQLLSADKEHLIEGVADSSALEHEIGRFTKAVEAFEEKEIALKKALDESAQAMNLAKGEADAAAKLAEEDRTSLEAAEQQWAARLNAGGFETEEGFTSALTDADALEALRRETEQYRAALAHAETELKQQAEAAAGKTRPDMNALTEELKAAQQARDSSLTSLAQAKDLADKLKALQASLKKELAELQKEEQDWSRRTNFVRQLDNSSGINLHRYVLAAMLDTVIRQANQLLEKVHGGRYQLRRSDTASGSRRKAGLELNVLDARTGSERSVKSLSGGEKFLVSLALAIGLNTVMQAQAHGIRVEAIFVDEGFGSLDDDSIGDAMQMLQTVRMSHGMVGVISHIDSLRGEIPVHIEVRKNMTTGSTLSVE